MNSPRKPSDLDLRLERLKTMITDLQEEAGLTELQSMLAEGLDPRELLACCMEGMRRVGHRFETGTYFIAGLIMAGEIMRSATELLSPHLTLEQAGDGGGRVMLGTIQGDIHDLGKNLFSLLLNCHGLEVIDLGVDVAPEIFLEKTIELQPDIVGISCVLTNSVDNLKKVVQLLREKLPAPGPSIIIGGTCLDQRLADYVGPVLWAQDAAGGLKLCQKILEDAKR
jgi:methanogenic corrinoid protein MtbC1